MQNALLLLQLVLQNATQLQGFAGTLQKAISEGRDVTPEELASASSALETHLQALQDQINAAKGKTP